MSNLSRYNARIAAQIMRQHHDVLSDEHMKEIGETTDPKELAEQILQQGPPYNVRELRHIVNTVGNMDEDHNFEKDGHMWSNDTLSKYADYIRNYAYTYKPEAQQLDPSIDPNEEHIGPMAQDIEKVNPAAVKTDESGFKSVDTGRLALMNAGAIADLAREVKELKHATT